jgi:hypothetical protein
MFCDRLCDLTGLKCNYKAKIGWRKLVGYG